MGKVSRERKETLKLITDLRIMEHGYDLMGYDVDRIESLSFHHLLVPAKNIIVISPELKKLKVHTDGYDYWNGAPLVRDTSHDYLHLIETYDSDIFYDITSEMIDQRFKGRLCPYNIRLIDMRLKDFEEEYGDAKGLDKQPLIKDEYRKRLSRVK